MWMVSQWIHFYEQMNTYRKPDESQDNPGLENWDSVAGSACLNCDSILL